MKNIFIVGATSGIGLELALQYAQRGDRVAAAGRNTDKLKELEHSYPGQIFAVPLDISISEDIPPAFDSALNQLGRLDLIIMSSSINVRNRELEPLPEEELIHINVRGYTLVLNRAMNYFEAQGGGQLAGITSIARFIASKSPGYSASKAWEAIYLEGLRILRPHPSITVTEIIPGFVRTPLIRSRRSLFWVTPVEKAAAQIIHGLDRRSETIYVSRRWRAVRWLIAILPRTLLRQIMIRKDNRA